MALSKSAKAKQKYYDNLAKKGKISQQQARVMGAPLKSSSAKISSSSKSPSKKSSGSNLSKYTAMDWGSAAEAAKRAGIDISTGSEFDLAMNQKYNPGNYGLLTGRDPSVEGEQEARDYSEPKRAEYIKQSNTPKKSSPEPKNTSSGGADNGLLQKIGLPQIGGAPAPVSGINLQPQTQTNPSLTLRGAGTGGIYDSGPGGGLGRTNISINPKSGFGSNELQQQLKGVGLESYGNADTGYGYDEFNISNGRPIIEELLAKTLTPARPEDNRISDIVADKPNIGKVLGDSTIKSNYVGGGTAGTAGVTGSAGSAAGGSLDELSSLSAPDNKADKELSKAMKKYNDLVASIGDNSEYYDAEMQQLDPQFSEFERQYKQTQDESLQNSINSMMGRQLANNAYDSSQTAAYENELRKAYGNQMANYLGNLATQKETARRQLLTEKANSQAGASKDRLGAYMSYLQMIAQQQQQAFENQLAMQNYRLNASKLGSASNSNKQGIGKYINELANNWVQSSGDNPYAKAYGREAIGQQVANVYGGNPADYYNYLPNGWESMYPQAPSTPSWQGFQLGEVKWDPTTNDWVDPFGVISR